MTLVEIFLYVQKSRKIILFLVFLITSACTLVIKVDVVQKLAFDILGVL